jgi:hypothetical protein
MKLRWPWSKKKPPPAIPPYVPPVREGTPKPEEIVVEEHDTSAMTQTGVHKAWKRLTGKRDDG